VTQGPPTFAGREECINQASRNVRCETGIDTGKVSQAHPGEWPPARHRQVRDVMLLRTEKAKGEGGQCSSHRCRRVTCDPAMMLPQPSLGAA